VSIRNRACLYLRTPQLLIEYQRQRLIDFAQQKEMMVVHEITEYGSACAPHRPCVDALLRMADAGAFDIVIAANTSRIARRPYDLVLIMSRLRKAGVEIWTVDTQQRIPYELLDIWESLAN